MLRQVAEGVLVHESTFCQTNSVIVDGRDGVLLIDPGVLESEVLCLAGDLADSGRTIAAGFSTHPHWDHLLWHTALGPAPRLATARATTTARERLAGGIDARRFGIPDEVSLELLGDIAGVPAGSTGVPWDGPRIRIIEHQAHAPGHAALLIEEARLLVAGDMLSDVLIPILDAAAADPFGDYLTALEQLEGLADQVDGVVPGHGAIGSGGELRSRLALDRAYVEALRDGGQVDDPRIGPAAKSGWGWVADVHEGQRQRLAARD